MEVQFLKNVHERYFVYEIMQMEDNTIVKFSTWIIVYIYIYLIG
jgi:hypothetical protein